MSMMRSSLLVGGVVLLIVGMLAIGHIPGVPVPKIQENRDLASRPLWVPTLAGLDSFRKGMDAYVADNFPARPYLIGAINYARYRMGYSGSHNVVVGKRGWLFFDDGSHLAQMRRSEIGAAEARAWAEKLNARTRFLKARGIQFLVLVPPVKERVYPELAPRWTLRHPGASDAILLEKLSAAQGSDNVLFPLQPLFAARAAHRDIYSPFDTHWTGFGAYVGYTELMRALARHGLTDKPIPIEHFRVAGTPDAGPPQDMALMLGISSFVEQRFPQLESVDEKAIASMNFLTERQDGYGDRIIDTGRPGKPVLLITGDSFSWQLIPFLYPHFSKIVVSHIIQGFFRLDLIDAHAPNFVILEVHERQVRNAMSDVVSGALRPTPRVDTATLPSTNPTAKVSCALDGLVRATTETGHQIIEASGWAADVENGRIPDSVTLLFQSSNSTYSATFPGAVDRADVAAAYHRPSLQYSGFDFIADIGKMTAGSYDAYLLEHFGSQSLLCTTTKKLDAP